MTASPSRIPLPEYLLPTWVQPEDADKYWAQDRMHYTEQMMILDSEILEFACADGANPVFELYHIPARVRSCRFWTWYFETTDLLPLPPAELEAMALRSEQAISAEMAQLERRWAEDWLPEIKAIVYGWEQYDLASATNVDLADHLASVVEQIKRLFAIHFEVWHPLMMAISLFEELYLELFGDEEPLRPYTLLQGFENTTVASGRAFWQLSRQVAANPPVRRVFASYPASEVVAALRESAEGREFLSDLSVYLDEYGRRCEYWVLVTQPSWIEDPAPALRILKGYLNDEALNPDLAQAALAAERERATTEARESLQTYPQAVRDQFEFLLQAARTGTVLTEDHGYWIDFRSASDMREILLEVGRRLVAADIISDANDFGHLTLAEILAALRGLSGDLHTTVADRRAEMERYRGVDVPFAIGVAPDETPPDDAGGRMMAKFFGARAQASADPAVLHGSAGSAGVVRGPVRIVRSWDEADLVQPGDILVAETTSPPWTPLFSTVAAVVTDTGGVLSHCAVVAREYGIPAVVATGSATHTLINGQIVEVDGSHGIVRIIST